MRGRVRGVAWGEEEVPEISRDGHGMRASVLHDGEPNLGARLGESLHEGWIAECRGDWEIGRETGKSKKWGAARAEQLALSNLVAPLPGLCCNLIVTHL